MVIHKFKLEKRFQTIINIPVTHKFLKVDIQDGEIFVWAIVDETEYLIEKKISMFMTGEKNKALNDMEYIGTVEKDSIVMHFFHN